MNKSLNGKPIQSKSILHVNIKLITPLLDSDGCFKHDLWEIKPVFILSSIIVNSSLTKMELSLWSETDLFVLPAVLPVRPPACRG